MKKKVLIVIQLIRRGGVELVAINFARALDISKFDITFLLVNPDEHNDEVLTKELIDAGYNIDYIPRDILGYTARYKYLLKYFSEKKYDIVHSHVLFFSGIVLKAAARCGIRIRVAHSHATKWNNKENIRYKFYKFFMRSFLKQYSNYKFACSKEAGEFMYGKKEFANNGIIINNGIDTNAFTYNESVRTETRKKIGINDGEVLIGHVGTIYRIKNQTYLIRVFYEFLKQNPNSRLILIGEEVEKEPVVNLSVDLGVLDRVIFTGQVKNVCDYYQAMDILMFPSLHEALPLSLIEAQATKLPCIISDTITKSVKFNCNVEFLGINENPEKWVVLAKRLLNSDRNNVNIDDLIKSYDINNVVKDIERCYLL